MCKKIYYILCICAILKCSLLLQVDAESLTPKTGENWTVVLSNDVKLEMVYIAPGTFEMGCPKDEPLRMPHETLRTVTLTKGYWLGKYEVTQKQWQAIMGNMFSIGWKRIGDDLPVHDIDWYAANEFCKRLNEREIKAGKLPPNYRYVLPTEAQWEYACRAGTKTALNNGKNITSVWKATLWGFGEWLHYAGFNVSRGHWTDCPNLGEVAWYQNNSQLQPHPVGLKKPNAWGLYDMHGNAAEWCADRKTKDYPGDTSNIDPISPPASMDRLYDFTKTRVVRGGSYSDRVDRCSQSRRDRDGSFPWFTRNSVGFRLALVYFDSEEDIPVNSIQIQYSDIPRKKSPREKNGGSNEKSN